MRIIIAGGPRCGKTTLARKLSHQKQVPLKCTDDLIGNYSWSEASAVASTWFDAPGPWIVEGVAAPRALRKWLIANDEGKPCDQLLVLEYPYGRLSKGQETMAKGVASVLKEVIPYLARRGVAIKYVHEEG